MKNTIKATLVALAVAGAASAAQAATYNSDLIIGFTVQSGNDLEYDLGSGTSLFDGETWDLSALVGTAGTGLNMSTVKWGVIGDTTTGVPHTIWATKVGAAPGLINGNAAWNNVNTPTAAMYASFPTAGAGQHISPTSSFGTGWNTETVVGGSNTYKNNYINPNTTGYATVNFWKTLSDNSAPSIIGTFSFDNTGTVTFDAVSVPEPSTYGMFAAAGVLLVGLRNQFRRKQA